MAKTAEKLWLFHRWDENKSAQFTPLLMELLLKDKDKDKDTFIIPVGQ